MKYTSYLVAELVWPLRQKNVWVPQRHLMAGGRRNGTWVFKEMKKWNTPYLPPPHLSFYSVVLSQFNRCFKSNCFLIFRHFSVSSSRWNGGPHLVAASFSSFITHTQTKKTLLTSHNPTPQSDFFLSLFSFFSPSSPYSVSLRVSFKFLVRVSSPFTLGWAFQALSASFKFLTSCRGRNKESEGGGKSPWSEIKRYISHETLCSDVE